MRARVHGVWGLWILSACGPMLVNRSLVDNEPPHWKTLAITHAAETNSFTTTPIFTFAAAHDNKSSANRINYHYALGTAVSALTDLVNWRPAPQTPFSVSGVQLREGRTYIVSLKATDAMGNAAVTSSTFVVNALDWRSLANLPDFITEIEATIATGVSAAPVVNFLPELGTIDNTAGGWGNFTLAPNGKLYACPLDAASVLVFDPVDHSSNILTALVSGGLLSPNGYYYDSVLALSGNIYCVPGEGAQVLRINPSNQTIDYVGTSFGTPGTKWEGAALAPNGKIYAPPCDGSNVLVINPLDDVPGDPLKNPVSTFAAPAGVGCKWGGIALHRDGLLYAAPVNSTEVLIIDPSDDTAVAVTPVLTADGVSLMPAFTQKYYGWAYDLRDSFFGLPFETDDALVFNVGTATFDLLATPHTKPFRWSAAIIGLDNKFYGIPYDEPSMITIGRDSRVIGTVGSFSLLGTDPFGGGAYGLDGHIYFPPRGADQVLQINLHLRDQPPPDVLLSPFLHGT